MSRVNTVVLPQIGNIQLLIKSKREIRAHPAYAQMESESNEWWYWNRVWHSEVALSEWLIQEFYPTKLRGKTILELGCGTGLAGIVCARLGGVPTFSDIVPMVMDSVKESCGLNEITDYQTLILDWSHPEARPGAYDMVLGSEIFYDVRFLDDLRELLKRALVANGRGVFCDPNRVGFDSLQECFSQDFQMNIQTHTVHWPQRRVAQSPQKEVFIYELLRR